MPKNTKFSHGISKSKVPVVLISLTTCLLLFLGGTYLRYLPTLSTINAYAKKSIRTEFVPEKIVIPTTETEAKLIPGGVSDGKWILSEDGIYFFPFKTSDFEEPSFILYGHNTKGLLMNLEKISINDGILLIDSQSRISTYKVYDKKIVLPTDINVLYPQVANELIVYTCTGWFDEKRLVVKAKKI